VFLLDDTETMLRISGLHNFHLLIAFELSLLLAILMVEATATLASNR
jgi:hypothetical protein